MDGLFSIIYNLLSDIFFTFFDVILQILSILPASPFMHLVEYVSGFEFLGYMNYFIPFRDMATVMDLWLTAVIAYYVYTYVRKYTDYIEQFTRYFGGEVL